MFSPVDEMPDLPLLLPIAPIYRKGANAGRWESMRPAGRPDARSSSRFSKVLGVPLGVYMHDDFMMTAKPAN